MTRASDQVERETLSDETTARRRFIGSSLALGAALAVDRDFGKIDIVVAHAAIQRWKPLLEMEDADWKDTIENNLNGTANTIRAFAPKLAARRRGSWPHIRASGF
jgi:NAD(P)-dependent dehydrogenase (short-subunit alcohol dehydrogenase family)